MTTIEELQSRAADAHPRFRSSLASVAPLWDEPLFDQDPGVALPGERTAWSPRDVAEHALSIEPMNMNFAREVVEESAEIDVRSHLIGLDDFDWGNRSFKWVELVTAGDATDAFERFVATWEALLASLEDDALALAFGLADESLNYLERRGVAVTKTVGGLLTLSAEHFADHGEQLLVAAAGASTEG